MEIYEFMSANKLRSLIATSEIEHGVKRQMNLNDENVKSVINCQISRWCGCWNQMKINFIGSFYNSLRFITK